MTIGAAGHNLDLTTQINCVKDILSRSRIISEVLKRAPDLEMPNWYLSAGCIAQTVWNAAHGFGQAFGIKDYDLVYYDSADLSSEAENDYAAKAGKLYRDLDIATDVKNEARVHLWYEQHFGYKIAPYESVEHAISTWPTTATSVAITTGTDGLLRLCAPFGLNDLLGLIVRPNKTQITKEIYQAKIARWADLWHRLRILSWD
jgi:uncharacterized protein